eukprot:2086760-Amphidinium_carterae.1
MGFGTAVRGRISLDSPADLGALIYLDVSSVGGLSDNAQSLTSSIISVLQIYPTCSLLARSFVRLFVCLLAFLLARLFVLSLVAGPALRTTAVAVSLRPPLLLD